MRIGVFGGTFDPVHWGHLILAEQCREQARLNEIWFVPAAHHPFKLDQRGAPFQTRVEMLRLAIANVDQFKVDEIERDLPAPNYTVTTLKVLAERHPGHEWFFLVGGDALEELPTWHEPEAIAEQATIVAMARPGHPVLSIGELRQRLSLSPTDRLNLQVVDVPLIDLSSRDIRRRVGGGHSVRFMLPRSVEDVIAQQCLYR
jgi:nicotinate-nucleotide adenylyltransferase